MEAFLNKFKYAVIIILALIIMVVSFANYRSIKDVIRGKYDSRQQLIEDNILQTVNHVSDSYKIVEKLLNQEMKEYSRLMQEKYRQDPNVMEWDLEELKNEFGDYEIYIIDSELKIIKTTYAEDLGFDFSQYGSFSKELRKRLEGDSFVVDRLDLATQTGEVKKYSYMPTPDNKYLLELSIEAQEKFPLLKRLDMFGDAAELTAECEMIEDISFYIVELNDHQVAKLRSSKKPYLQTDVPDIEDELARQAILTDEAQTGVSETAGNDYTYRFFPALFAGEDGGWNSYVVGIIYNDRVMLQEISRHRNLFYLNIGIMILIFVGYIAMVLYFLRKFEHQAYHDQLTGLADRELFFEKFARLKKEADRRDEKVGIVFLDVNKFKMINDNFGHDAGDRVLKDIASRLAKKLRSRDLLARLGGDEFLLALADISSKEQVVKAARRIIDEFKEPLIINGAQVSVSISGGVSIYPEDGSELEQLINNADNAMYRAKREQKDLEVTGEEDEN